MYSKTRNSIQVRDTVQLMLGAGYDGSSGYWGFDDVYANFTRARVEICDASSWQSRSECEIQLPFSWSNTELVVTVNQGAFLDGATAYLYVVDPAGGANSAGYPVIFGGTCTSDCTGRCGGSNDCAGTCPDNCVAPETCGGGGIPNVCGPSGVDVDAPILSSLGPSTDVPCVAGASINVNLAVTTNEAATCRFGSAGATWAQMTVMAQTGGTMHGQLLSLACGQTHYYDIRCRDAANNESSPGVIDFTTTATALVTNIILDNTDSNSTSTGNWTPSTFYPDYYGVDYLYSSDAVTDTFTWTTSLLEPGTYDVFAWWAADSTRPADVSYEIEHASDTSTVSAVDQRAQGAQWVLLGTYDFVNTGTVTVMDSANGTGGACADAVRFAKTGGACVPDCTGICGGSDGCTGTCLDNCVSPQTCGGGGVVNECGCTPTSCEAEDWNCGTALNSCGGTVSCGACTPPEACGGDGPNRCGEDPCVSKTCADLGASCGGVSDQCSSILLCGMCAAPNTCGGGGTANQCGCTPRTCENAGIIDGQAEDGCGGVLSCGSPQVIDAETIGGCTCQGASDGIAWLASLLSMLVCFGRRRHPRRRCEGTRECECQHTTARASRDSAATSSVHPWRRIG